jgi:hypothetical protein
MSAVSSSLSPRPAASRAVAGVAAATHYAGPGRGAAARALGLAAGGTAGALLAEHPTGSATAAGLPLAVLVLGSGIAAVVVTRVMDDPAQREGDS